MPDNGDNTEEPSGSNDDSNDDPNDEPEEPAEPAYIELGRDYLFADYKGGVEAFDDLDTCALFLASPMSTYVNGQNIAVDGGFTCV